MRQPQGLVRYRSAYATPVRRRTTKKEPRRSPRTAAALEERIEEIMDRVHQADDNQVERAAASCLSALGRPSDEIQQRAAERTGEHR